MSIADLTPFIRDKDHYGSVLTLAGLHDVRDRAHSSAGLQASFLSNCETLISEARLARIPLAYLRHVDVQEAKKERQYPTWLSGLEPTREDMIFDIVTTRPYQNAEFSEAISYGGGKFWLAGCFDSIDCASIIIAAGERRQHVTLISDALIPSHDDFTTSIVALICSEMPSNGATITTQQWLAGIHELKGSRPSEEK